MSSETTPAPATFLDNKGQPVELLLYGYDACPFCARVRMATKNLGLSIPMRDTLREPGAREELRNIGGKTQVPCLLINGAPLYESADIIRFLENEVSGPA